jgi:alpha-N-acetylglucosamine transferase
MAADNNHEANDRRGYHYSESYLAESERRLNNLTIETATLREKSINVDRVLARIELVLNETQVVLQKLSSFNDASTLSIERLIDQKLDPLKAELVQRKEEVIKLRTTIAVIAAIASSLFVFVEVFHEHIINFFSKG